MSISITPSHDEQVFLSRDPEGRVVRFPELTNVVNGIQNKISPGLAYEFTEGALRVDDELRRRDEWFVETYGHNYQPETADGYLSTEDWLRRRSGETQAFWERPLEAPSPNDDLRRITNLVIDGDTAGLLALYETEERGWKRPDVLEAAEEALTRLGEREEGPPPAA